MNIFDKTRRRSLIDQNAPPRVDPVTPPFAPDLQTVTSQTSYGKTSQHRFSIEQIFELIALTGFYRFRSSQTV